MGEILHYKERERRLWKKWSPVRLKVSRLIAIWKSDIKAKGLKKIGEDMKKKQKSIKINLLMNTLKTLMSLIFP